MNNLNLKTMKKRSLFTIAALAAGLIFTSCEDDEATVDTEAPQITDLEVGHDGELHTGEDVHLEFNVTDNVKLAYYEVEIHAEGEEDHDHRVIAKEHWEYENRFDEISGLRNKEVHHHDIQVPDSSEVELGEYHFHLLVADEAGNTTESELELMLVVGDGEHDDDHDH